MSSLSKNANGSWRLRFADKVGGETRRVKLTLPKSSQHVAEAVAARVDALIASRVAGVQVDHKTLTWLGEVDDDLYGRLERAGLVRPRQRVANAKATLGDLVGQWQAANTHHKPNTIRNNRQTGEKLLKHIGAATPVAGLTVGDAKRYVAALQKSRSAKGKTPAPATIAREIKRARQVFTHAVDHGMIAANPFAGIKAGSQANKERQHFVALDVSHKVLAACPDNEWRLIFALCRFGGLRCPSEVLSLTWDAVLWDQSKIRVASPKTEHLAGGGSRLIPLFPELRPHLEQAFEDAPAGATYVISRYRDTNANLRTQLLRIIDKAGVDRWPKVFQNLRSTRETELMRAHPAHVACAWIGNTEAVALKHYAQVTDEDFEQASGIVTVAQNVAHHPAELGRTEPNEIAKTPRNSNVSRGLCASEAPPRGCEHQQFPSSPSDFPNGEAQNVAHIDPLAWALLELAKSGLPEEQRSAMAQALIKAASPTLTE